MLIRKMWNPRAFKAQVSPHELLQVSNNCNINKIIKHILNKKN